MTAFIKAAATALFLLTALAAGAQTLDSDLRAALTEAELSFSVTKSGNAAVTFEYDDERSQVVYVSGRVQTLEGLSLREVWSNAGDLDADVEWEILAELLQDGGRETLGAWNLEESDEGYLAYYSAKVPTALDPADLRSVLDYIAAVADNKEAEWYDEDIN